MAAEPKRGCGYRKVNGIYLVTDPGKLEICDRMPIVTKPCEHCERMGFTCGLKPARGFTWVNPQALLQGDHIVQLERRTMLLGRLKPAVLCPEDNCPVCRPGLMGEKAGLLWINTKHYTPESFISEAIELGMSRRIPAIPRGFVVGETFVLFAQNDYGIFLCLRPKRIEQLVKMSEYDKKKDKLEKQGITLVLVPDSDKDHQ